MAKRTSIPIFHYSIEVNFNFLHISQNLETALIMYTYNIELLARALAHVLTLHRSVFVSNTELTLQGT